MAININLFLDRKYKELELDKEIITEDLYDFVADPRLKYIFSVLHQEINSLIKFMFKKTNGHFNAEQSRKLLYYTQQYKDIKQVLKNTGNAFEIDKNYDRFLKRCNEFLMESGGSTIPDDLEKIDIFEYEPIFSFTSHVEIKSSPLNKQYSLQLIGEGSYAKVYKYIDEFYNIPIIVKRAHDDLDEKELERFKKEYETMKSLNSPYILKVYSYDEKKNQYFAEYADLTIEKYIENNNQKLTLKERYGIIMQILKGFKYVHSKHIYHRDISPKNILLKKYDDNYIVKISDFGLVKNQESTLTTLESEIKGSFNDVSNLKLVGFSKYSVIHETYALTRLIIYILTGKYNLDKVENDEIKKFMLKGLNSDTNKRFKNVDELIDEFNRLYKSLSK